MSDGVHYADGIITQPDGMICFLNLERIFEEVAVAKMRAA